ncbi:MAG: ribonuclease P protein component [Bacteroidota bacterium]
MTSARYGLPKSHRLLKPTEYTATQKGGQRWRDELLRVYAVPNPHSYGRLGIVISRRVSPRAVIRNRVKRHIRESFRHSHTKLSGLDIVVVANPTAAQASAERLRGSLQQMWEMVEQQCRRS